MQKNTAPGKFIAIEGLDGSGQTTQVKLLADFFAKKGYGVVATKEPTGDSEAGRQVKKILEEKIETDSFELQTLFAQDRREHVANTIVPALAQGKIVLCDRYFFSAFAYGEAHGAGLEKVIELNKDALYPDIAFLLKVSPATCMARIEKRGTPRALFEKQERLTKVWDVFEKLPERFEKLYIVDGELSPEEVFFQMREIISAKLSWPPTNP